MITRGITVVGEINSNLHLYGVTMSVSLAVYSQVFVEHIHTWYDDYHHLFKKNTMKYHDEEDGGYLICLVYDENTRKSNINEFNAKTKPLEPITIIYLPTRVHYSSEVTDIPPIQEKEIGTSRQLPRPPRFVMDPCMQGVVANKPTLYYHS